jgi:hypothetical protein
MLKTIHYILYPVSILT